MFVEKLTKAEIAILINKLKKASHKDQTLTTEEDIELDTAKHHDGKNYIFIKSNDFLKCWVSDFTCATRLFDASPIYRTMMANKFGQEYIDSFRNHLTEEANEKIENEMKKFENSLNL